MSDEGSFGNLSWPALSAKDLEQIDQVCEEVTAKDHKGASRVSIEIGRSADGDIKEGRKSEGNRSSPYSRFRSRGYLTVSDVVSPAWCEVQFDYGLHQHRNKPLSSRPKSFVTEKGKEIHVKTDIASMNDRVLTKGTNVHRVLEKEIHKEEVVIKVKSLEESWAVRLLDFLSRLKVLKESHVCREIPVWGIVHGEALTGTIDELQMVLKGPAPKSRRRKRKNHVDDSQTRLDSFYNADKESAPPLAAMPSTRDASNSAYIIHILDNKTRKAKGIPSHADTLPSRLQLMLYRRLLDQVLCFDPDVFQSYCARIGLDPKRPFTEKFKTEMSTLVVHNQLSLRFHDANCLEDLVGSYTGPIKDMAMNCDISMTLSLVYRLRGSQVKKARKSLNEVAASSSRDGRDLKGDASPSLSIVEEAVERSEPACDAKVAPPMDTAVDIIESADAECPTTPVSPPSRKRKRRTPRTPSASTEASADEKGSTSGAFGDNPRSAESDSDVSGAKSLPTGIIGTKKFNYNAKLLDAYLTSVLLWWHGKRPPQGVDIENTSRCNSCEYRNGCEWREQKALEFTQNTGSFKTAASGRVP